MKQKIKDFRISKNKKTKDLLGNFSNTGFQASELSKAVEIIKTMKKGKCTIYLSFTANLVATGLRGIIADLCKEKFVDAIVTTSGSIDHDIIKSFTPYYTGDFESNDSALHKKGINRIGNIFVPNKGFVILEKKFQKWLLKIYSKQTVVLPTELCNFVGSKLGKDSFLYWCTKNNIPVFCPGITDGAIGLQMNFFKQEHSDFVVDVAGDVKKIVDFTLDQEKTGAIVLGGGISKHHTIGANIVRNGLDYAVYISTATEFDGSLSGARTREAKSWGKLKEKAKSVNVFGDATIIFPLIISALK